MFVRLWRASCDLFVLMDCMRVSAPSALENHLLRLLLAHRCSPYCCYYLVTLHKRLHRLEQSCSWLFIKSWLQFVGRKLCLRSTALAGLVKRCLSGIEAFPHLYTEGLSAQYAYFHI